MDSPHNRSDDRRNVVIDNKLEVVGVAVELALLLKAFFLQLHVAYTASNAIFVEGPRINLKHESTNFRVMKQLQRNDGRNEATNEIGNHDHAHSTHSYHVFVGDSTGAHPAFTLNTPASIRMGAASRAEGMSLTWASVSMPIDSTTWPMAESGGFELVNSNSLEFMLAAAYCRRGQIAGDTRLSPSNRRRGRGLRRGGAGEWRASRGICHRRHRILMPDRQPLAFSTTSSQRPFILDVTTPYA